jgi:hypothetical protein
MKILLRSLLVLAVAVVLGVVFYYAIQALPGLSFNPPPGARLRPEAGRNVPDRTAPRPEHRENERGRGSLSLLAAAGRVVLFSVLVFVSVLGKNLIFEGRLFKKRSPD